MCTGTHPFIPVSNTARVIVRSVFDGQHVENTFWVNHTGPFAPADLDDIATAFADWYISGYLPTVSEHVVGSEIEVTDYTAEDGLRVVDTAIGGEAGAQTQDALPNNVAAKMKFGSSIRGV